MPISGFETDIFISYNHGDNEAVAGAEGWVAEFHRRLRVRLRQIAGVEPAIWRDPRLGAADVFPAKIASQLARTAILLPIISPGYLRSEWCTREIREFERAAAAAGGLQVSDSMRVVKVVKTPSDGDRHREFLPNTLGCEFYQREPETGYFREFRPGSDEYERTLDCLAQEIHRLLGNVQTGGASTAIYLAETAPDLRDKRTQLSHEFADRNCAVLPDPPLPADADQDSLARRIRESLQQAAVSVHIFGARYGAIPDGGERSIPALQYDLAVETGKPLVVWIAPDANAPAPRQAEFLQQVVAAVDARQELLNRKSIEDVKDVILERIAAFQKPAVAAAAAARADDRPQVYLVCDREDHPTLQGRQAQPPPQSAQLKQFLADQGFVVWLPMTDEADAGRLREDHKQTLQISDAVVVFWGHASHGWFREKLRELVQAKGWGGARHAHTTALYIAAPESPERREYQRHEEFVFLQFEGFEPSQLATFVKRVAQPHSAAGLAGGAG